MFHSPFDSTLVDVPRPHLDPVCTFQEALAIVSLAARHPLSADTVVLQLDRRMRGVALTRLTSGSTTPTHDPGRDLARSVVEHCAANHDTAHAFVVSFRPWSPITAADASTYTHLSSSLASAGFHLLDWTVVGRGGFWCPRVLVDAPNPWHVIHERG